MHGIKTEDRNEIFDFVTSGPIWETADRLGLKSAASWNNDELPPYGHWFFCHDGQPSEAEPYLLAGGDIVFHKPILYGVLISRLSEKYDVREKTGRSGRLTFRSERHRYVANGQLLTSETEDWVAIAPWPAQIDVLERAIPSPSMKWDWERDILLTPKMQIGLCGLLDDVAPWHICRDYCKSTAGYPGLLVHGRMVAILLMDLFQRQYPTQRINRFSYRVPAPAFDKQEMRLRGLNAENGAYVWAENAKSQVVMHARIQATGSS